MEFIDPALLAYAEKHSEPESPLLRELNRQTHLRSTGARMLSGHLQGRLLAMISRLLAPELILEIGTFTGYSALCLAEGLSGNGRLITIDPNEETNAIASGFIARSPHASQVTVVCGNAQNVIPALPGTFDLVFIDADKQGYAGYLDLVAPRVRTGGVIIADNVLWSGKVLQPSPDRDTAIIRAFNEKAAADKRFQPLMLPVRDGLLILRKLEA